MNHRTTWLSVTFVTLAMFALIRSGTAATKESAAPEIKLSCHAPFDVTVPGKPTPTLESLQHDFDVFSWESFIALNWPVQSPDGAPGQADCAKKIGQGGDHATGWETWKESFEVFRPRGEQPAPWYSKRVPPEICADRYQGVYKVLQQVGKTANVLDETTQPFATGPLIDQNGEYSRMEILMNELFFDYIVENTLYSQKGQGLFRKKPPPAGESRVCFPFGQKPTTDKKGKHGAIMVKATWKVLGVHDDSARFHTIKAYVLTEASDIPKVKATCEVKPLGLVGLHIVTKTASAAQWIWSTFEHVDNAPSKGEIPKTPEHYNYYNQTAKDAPINEPPPKPWNPNKKTTPTQVVRIIPLDEATKKLNQEAQAALRKIDSKTVWQYYELISTQWPTHAPSDPCGVTMDNTDRVGTPAPQFLANTTLETYVQGKVPLASSSCMDCHVNATGTNGRLFSDFTYLLERAE